MSFGKLKIDVDMAEHPVKTAFVPPPTPVSTMSLVTIMSQTATKKAPHRKTNNLQLSGRRQTRTGGMGMMFR